MNPKASKTLGVRSTSTASSMLIRNVPPDLMRQLDQQAQEDMRTLSNEVIWILQDWMRTKKQQQQ